MITYSIKVLRNAKLRNEEGKYEKILNKGILEWGSKKRGIKEGEIMELETKE